MAKINLNAPIKQSWASELQSLGRRTRDREELTSNRESQALAAIAALEDQGEVLSDAQKVDILNQYVRTGDFTLSDIPKEDFSGVTGGAVVLPQDTEEEPGFLRRRFNESGAVIDALQAGAYRDAAAVLGRAGRSENAFIAGAARQVAQVPALFSDTPVLPVEGNSADAVLARSEDALRRGLGALRSAAERNMQESNRTLSPIIEEGGVRGLAARTFQDAAQSGASSAASIVGGPAAGVMAGGITYANAYEEAIEQGLTPAQAEEYAVGQGTIEGAVSSIPAERFIPGLGPVLRRFAGTGVRSLDNMITSPAIATAARTAATVVGEGVSEASTEFAQSLAAAAQAGMAEDQRQRSFLTQAADLENLGENVTRAGLAGALMGGAISAPINTVQERQRYNERVQQTSDNTAQNIREGFNQAATPAPVLPAEAGTQPATFGMDIPNVDRELFNAEQDAARQAEIDRAFEQRETEERLQREVEEEAGFRTMEAQRASGPMAEQLRSVVNTEVTPEQVAAERITQARIEQRGVGAPAQQAPVEAPATPEVVVQPAPTRRSRSAPKRTAPAPVAQLEQSTDPDDQRAAAIMKLVGDTLGMSGTQTASTSVPADFNTKVDAISNALARDSSREAAAVEQLIADRRLIVAPNAASVGRTSDPNTPNRGEYDSGTGITYLYTDFMGDNPLADIMTVVPHEGTHVGQMSTRDGRSQAMQALLGAEGPATLRQLAANGHTAAKEALRKARADTAARANRGEENPARYEDAELAAYFVSEIRGKPAGRARGALNSMVANARSVMRDRLGVDLPITANDLADAAQRVVEEAAVTPPLTRETLNPDVLGMIYNQNSRGFDEALANGYVYDSVDGRRKYVLSDEDALVRQGVPEALAQSNTPMRTEEALDHDVLYREHPEARNIPVYAADDLGDNTTFAFYDPTANEIWVRRDVANATNSNPNAPTFKGALMHELQHYVQREGGYDTQYFDSTAPSRQMAEATTAFTDAENALNTQARTFLDNILAAVPSQQDKNAVMRDIMRGASSDMEMASRVRDTVQGMENVTPEAEALIAGYEQARMARNDAARQLVAARNNQHNEYLRNITEREAHFTQYQTQASQMGMEDNTTGINPEPVMRNQEADPETGIDPTQGAIDVPVDTPEGRQVQARSQEAQRLAELEARIAQMEAEDGRDFDLIERLQETPLYRGNREGATSNYSSDGALGPGHYYTSDRGAAQSYGPNVQAVNADVSNPLVITMEEVNANDGNTAMAIANNEAFANENFNTRAGASRWAREQWEDWSGVGDPEFQQMARDAGYDSVFLMDGDAVVEANIFNQRNVIPSNDTLGMAASTPEARTAFRNRRSTEVRNPLTGNNITVVPSGTALLSLVRNDKGMGKNVRDAVELAQSATAEYDARAAQAAGVYQEELARLAAQRGVTVEALNSQIEKDVAALNTTDTTPSEAKAAFTAMTRKYGEAGRALQALRNLNDDLSRSIIDTYLQQGRELSPSEVKQLQAVASNLGKYVHRTYASRLPGDRGKNYTDRVEAAIERHKKGKKLTPKEKELYTRYQNAVKYIIEDVTIPDRATLNRSTAERVNHLYNTWVSSKDMGLDKAGKIDKLEDILESITPEALEQQADKIITALLNPFESNASLTTQYTGGQGRDNTIMKKRKDIPNEIRDLMGEVTDPVGALVVTAAAQAQWLARTKMFLELQDVASPQDLQPPTALNSAEVRDNNMTPLTGEQFGPLEGWYASPAMHAMVDGVRESLMSMTDAIATGQDIGRPLLSKGADVWKFGVRTLKFSSIVLNLARWTWTAASSFGMPVFNGNFNPKTYVQGMQDAGALVLYAINPKRGLGSAERVVRNRVVDSAQIGDLKSIDNAVINEIIDAMSKTPPKGIPKFLRNMYKSGKLGLREFYAMLDVWSKIANFHNEVNYLTSYYKDAGITKTAEQIDREASTIVSDTNIGWNRTAPVVKSMERGGLSTFAPYLYDTFRVQFTNLAQGVAELERANRSSNSKAANRARLRAMQRIGGQTAFWTAATTISQMLAGIFGDDEDAARKVGLYDSARNEDYLPVGVGEDGLVRLFRFSDFDPLGPAMNMMRAVRSGASAGDVWKEFIGNYVAPSFVGNLFTAGRQTLANSPDADRSDVGYVKQPMVEQWFGDVFYNRMLETGSKMGVADNTIRAWNNLAESIVLPGTMRAWSKDNLTPLKPPGEGALDSAASNIYSAMRYAGARSITYDPKVGGREAREAYSNTVTNARASMADYIRRTNNPTPEELLAKATELTRQEKEGWDKLHRMYQAMDSMGMTSEQITKALADGYPALPKTVMNQLPTGDFQSRLIDKNSFQQRAQRSIDRAKTQREKDELTERWENAWDVLQLYQGAN